WAVAPLSWAGPARVACKNQNVDQKERLMPADSGYVIVGASLAGAKAAETLREEGFDGPVTLIGAEPHRPYERPPLSKGVLLGDVMYRRTVDDSLALRDALKGGGRVVIAGAGWIGLETAAAARKYGCEVTVVEPDPGALHRSVGPEIGAVFAKLHESHGVAFR